MRYQAIKDSPTGQYVEGDIYEGRDKNDYQIIIITPRGGEYHADKVNFKVLGAGPKKLFNGEPVFLKDGAGAKNRALKSVLESQGYKWHSYSTEYLDRNPIVINFRGYEGAIGTAYPVGVVREVTLEEVLAEIFSPAKPTEKTLDFRINDYNVLVKKDGTVKVGCHETTVDAARAIIAAYEALQ